MAPISHLEDSGRIIDYKNWRTGLEGFEYDSGLSPQYQGRFTSSFLMKNGLLAKVLVANGPFMRGGKWHNERDEKNVEVLLNAYEVSKKLEELGDWRINVPHPEGLYNVRAENLASIHPALVMGYIKNDFYKLDEEKELKVLKTRDQMIDATIENGFEPSLTAWDLGNFIYNASEDRVYLTGFGFWKAPK